MENPGQEPGRIRPQRAFLHNRRCQGAKTGKGGLLIRLSAGLLGRPVELVIPQSEEIQAPVITLYLLVLPGTAKQEPQDLDYLLVLAGIVVRLALGGECHQVS